jgi:hypothetical protein
MGDTQFCASAAALRNYLNFRITEIQTRERAALERQASTEGIFTKKKNPGEPEDNEPLEVCGTR